MAIEETRKKITFVPFEIKKGRAVDTSPVPTVTLNKGALRFNKILIKELNLNGKFVKFFYDPIKNIIGWQIKTEVNLQVVGKTWKMVKQNPTIGSWTVNIGKMLELIDKKAPERVYYQLPVKKYVEANGMDKGTVYYFVELVGEAEAPPGEKGSKSATVSDKDLDTALQGITQ